jgi:phage tail sheath protein FI
VVKSYDDSTKTVTLKANLQNSYEARYTTVTTDISPGATTPIVIRAISQGAWANAEANTLVIQVFHTSKGRAQVQQLVESTPGSGNFDTVVLNSASSFYPGAIVEFNNGKTKTWGKVSKVAGTSIVLKTPLKNANALDVDASMDKTKFPATIASTCEFRLTAASMGVTEDYPILTLDDTTPYYFGKLVNNISKLITISGSDNATETPFTMPSAKDGLNVIMGGGLDGGEPTYNDYIGQDNGPGMRTGLKALEDIEQISIIAAPGITDQSVQNELINQCERLRYRFAILDPKYGTTTPLDDVENQRQLYDTHYAALYFPNVVISNPDPASPAGSTIVMPPSGHMAGIYARTDIERGVYKAPANEVILGITDLDLNITKGEQDILNPPPYQINVLRNFRHQGRGLRVWGARCITSDAQWKYVNVRRLFIFVEASLDQGTQWVVFEPNDYPLWDRVKQSISNFLTSVWRDGALMGTKVEEAFFVRVGRSTMTQDDIDNGRLIILVGIAPVKPAEFVIIRISQFTASASTTGQ